MASIAGRVNQAAGTAASAALTAEEAASTAQSAAETAAHSNSGRQKRGQGNEETMIDTQTLIDCAGATRANAERYVLHLAEPMSAMQALLVALGLSVAGNAALGRAWIEVREKAATSTLQRDDARAAASACSDATEDLLDLADKRAMGAKKAQAQARSAATGRQQTANTILSTPAAVPGDACASAQVRSMHG